MWASPGMNANQRYEGSPYGIPRMAFPAPYQGDFKRECVSPIINRPSLQDGEIAIGFHTSMW